MGARYELRARRQPTRVATALSRDREGPSSSRRRRSTCTGNKYVAGGTRILRLNVGFFRENMDETELNFMRDMAGVKNKILEVRRLSSTRVRKEMEGKKESQEAREI